MAKRNRIGVVVFAVLLACVSARAQQSEVSYSDDFQSYGTQSNPPGWIDTSVGNPHPQAKGLYKTWPDPLQGNQGSNVVYGTKQSSGNPEGPNPRIGTFSTYTAKTFAAAGRFEYRGRLIRNDSDARVGLTFFSSYPELDKYYLIGLWSAAGSSNLTMQLFGFGAGAFSGTVNSNVAVTPNQWYRFLIAVDDTGSATRVRARFWVDGTPEPSTFSIDASDAAATRLQQGRIGIWAADHGSSYVDDLNAKSPADQAPPAISFFENNAALPANGLTRFGREARVDVRATSALGIASLVVTLDGQSYTPLAPIAADGLHTIVARATDTAGGTAQSQTQIQIDQTAPVVAVTENGQPFVSGTAVQRNLRPQITVSDGSATTIAAQLNGVPYTFGTEISAEGRYTLTATVTDEYGRFTTIAPILFSIDRTAPVVALFEGQNALTNGQVFNRTVTPRAVITDTTATSITATLLVNGTSQPYVLETPIGAEGTYALSVRVTDAVGLVTDVPPVTFFIDKTGPAIAFTNPAADAVLGTTPITVAGNADDAISVTLNGVAATVDTTARTFVTASPVELVEGENPLTAIGVDRAGNRTTIRITVRLDTRAPELAISAPASNACLNAAEVQIAGTATDAALSQVKVSAGGTPVLATIAADHRSFSATLPVAAEGELLIRIEAIDATGHSSTATVPVTIDRTRPVVEVTENGHPFTATLVNRPVSLFVRAMDADPAASLVVTLNGQPYASGATIAEERAHELRATARDCAGLVSDQVIARFTIDRTAPHVDSFTPANGSTIGTRPPITGVLSEAATLVEERTGRAVVVNGTGFAFDGALQEGINTFSFLVTDLAGNETRVAYSVTVDTSAPSVEILENGSSIAAGALFARAVTPVLQTSDAAAIITATLNGAPFASGTTLSADGAYTINAKARDTFGNESATAIASFRIDRTAPTVSITSPAAGSVIDADSVEVRGSVSGGDIATVTVNGNLATLTGSSFSATILLDLGANVFTVVATDHAGNAATASIEVERDRGRGAIVLTAPPDRMVTNRPTTIVAGQVLTPAAAQSVTLNGQPVPLDPAGLFRRGDFALTEGENVITATLLSTTGPANSVRVTVTADFTPPTLNVFANGSALNDGARFATSPALTLQATDNATTAVATTLAIDGEGVAPGVTALSNGGHALTAIARDAAGNETRVDRVFFIGDAASISGCGLSNIEPASNTSVFSETIHISGHSGGAAGVLINGLAASVADGSFCGEATLVAGRNEVTIQCADAAGHPTTDAPVVLVIHRYGDPEIAITAPASGSLVTVNKVTVTGTVGAGVVSGDVNGIAFTVPEDGAGTHTFSVPDVPVTPGLNVLIARAKTSSSRSAATSVQVRVAGASPQLSITSPLTGTETGAQSIDVSGTWTNVDPSTLSVSVGAATYPAVTTATSDTTGTFTASGIALSPGATTTIRASARSSANAQASTTTDVRQVATAPSIAISSPADNTFFASTHTGPVSVSGTINADPGSQVQVNGVLATLTGNSFNADVDISAAPSGITPVIARVITPDGRQATDSVRLVRLLTPLAVKESFPAADANGVDPGVAIIVLFTNAVDKASAAAFRVTDPGGTPLAGTIFVDRDAITFAPAQPLRAGQRYTVAVGDTLKDVSGAPMVNAHTFSFSVAGTAPSTAPLIDETTTTGCFSGATITGRVSVPGARARLDVDGVTMTAVSSETGAFKFTFTFSGQSGYHLVRVREIGTDGTLSAERTLCFRISCSVPQVVNASLDRTAKTLTIHFSRAMDPASMTVAAAGSIVVVPEGETALTGTLTFNATNDVATIALPLVPQKAIALTVKKSVKDAGGAALAADYTQTFLYSTEPTSGHGNGYVTGGVYDATNGRPLDGASVSILHSPFPILNSVRGRYARALPEGAYTIEASAAGYTSVWRQVVVPAGAGVVPIDIRLTKRGAERTTSGAALTLTNGGDTKVTTPIDLALTAASLPNGKRVRLTSVGAQSLAGLLPLGWSPLAAAEITVDDSSAPLAVPAATLTFHVDAAAVTAATQTLTLVQYDSERDEWRVVVPVANVAADGRVVFDIASSGNFALVYPDRSASLVARTGATLPSAPNPCVTTPDVCRVVSRTFVLDPKAVLPSGRTVATLTTDGTKPYPSGTAVQAFIDEQLNLADGRVLVDPPFATDLLLYRTLAGDAGVADFHLSPSAQAMGVVLKDGVDHIRIVDYPGRIDRGTLIGAEGGRVPGDACTEPSGCNSVTIDIPAGATAEPLHAAVAPMAANDLASFGPIAGFRVAGGFRLSLTRTSAPDLPEGIVPADVELLAPARATLSVTTASMPSPNAQIVLAEVLPATSFGVMMRLVALTSPMQSLDIPGVRVVSTRAIVSTQLPLDGLVRPGQYLVLVAESPIAFAYGQVKLSNGLAASNARVTASSLGVRDLTRIDGLFALPVPAVPAAPFTLVPRSTIAGDGALYTASSSPAVDAFVNVGALTLAAQPPRLLSVSPADGAQADAGALVVQAVFDVAIEAASVANGISLIDTTTNAAVAGAVSLNGATIVRFTPAQALRPASRYAITIAPAIRATNGAAFGRTATSQFTTRALAVNANVRPERIHITIPDATGRSTISGSTGALPGGSIALAVRRGQFFLESYTTTVAADGSFSFDAGHRNARDRITTDDAIDLEVLDSVSRAIIAVIELTPFTTADGRGFLARRDRESTFTSVDGIRVVVPAGAFDVATLVTVAPSTKTAFAGVPKFDEELGYATSAEITFDGVAKKPLSLGMPVPVNLNPSGRTWLLGYLGHSVRGPRVMIVDQIYVDGGMFKTGLPPSTSSARRAAANASISGQELQQYLAKVRRSGIYASVDLSVPGAGLAAGFIQGLQGSFDMFWNTMESLYAAYFFVRENEGRFVIPVVTGRPFTIVGVDATTGLEAFAKVYDPIAPGDPGAAVILPSPYLDRVGPYPVFGTPFRVEAVDVSAEGVALTSVADFSITLAGGRISAQTTLPSNVRVSLFNASKGELDSNRADGLVVPGQAGDRVVLFVARREVDPNTTLSVVFSEPLALPADSDSAIEDYLRNFITLTTRAGATGDFLPITGLLHLKADSGGRRILIESPASFGRGNEYRLEIAPELTDRSGLGIGQLRDADGNAGPQLTQPLVLAFQVRAPGGPLASFDLDSGAIRDQALNGNVLFISAQEGGILAYDVSDPASMSAATRPIGRVSGGASSYWGIASDPHGRVYATGMGSLFGFIHSFRLEDFLPTAAGTTREVHPHASTSITWVPGASAELLIGSRVIADDRPEAIPRKLQIVLQDDPTAYGTRAAFKSATNASVTSTTGDLEQLEVNVPRDADFAYATQRITVENTTLDMRWSADAVLGVPAKFTGIVARAGDQLRVIRNRATYGVVSLFGYGVGVFDLNAIDSNDVPDLPSSIGTIREKLRITNGKLPSGCDPLTPDAIPDLTFSPDASILPDATSADLHVFALDANRGVLDLTIHPPTPAAGDDLRCEDRAPYGLRFRNVYTIPGNPAFFVYDDPRLAKLRALFKAKTGRDPVARFTGSSLYRWTLEAKDNRLVTAEVPLSASSSGQPALGVRGSMPGARVTRDYMLIPGNEYGLLVVEVGGDPAPRTKPGYTPLQPFHLVDVIWIPDGAYAVRTIPRTNLASVVDGKGHILLVDLSRIDERWSSSGPIADDALFSTVAGILADNVTTPDPRIVWKSATPLASGTLAPVIDPETGFVFAGRMLEKTTNVVSAVDPRIQIKADVGSGNGLSEIGGIVPLGVDPPAGVLRCDPSVAGCNASLAAFRLEVSLPGAIRSSLGDQLVVALESERVFGAVTEQTPEGFPVAHLRRATRSGAADVRADARFVFTRTVPASLASSLRYQRGFNKWISPWVVAVADPRASRRYVWPGGSNPAAEGCASCSRPQNLRGLDESAGVFELYTNGRLVAVRPEATLFAGTGYEYLGNGDRLATRFATVMADTVRPPAVLAAAQNPAIAGGMLQETTYLHSGEVETSNIDLDAGGRAGWNATFDRTYRSRTIGSTELGAGWDSSMLRRLRELPNGNVEYRDGAGEQWLFTINRTTGAFERPRGLFLNLARTDRGFVLVGQQQKVTAFDAMGRLVHEADEFATNPYANDNGNVVRYLYDATGRLAQVIDPIGRVSQLAYYPETAGGKAGKLRSITDWRGRVVDYDYDAEGRLTEAALPRVSGMRPKIAYGYETIASPSFLDALELTPNLKAITDPIGGTPRLSLVYGSGADRDRVLSQQWATGESARFEYRPGAATVFDGLQQQRDYILTANAIDYAGDRPHVRELDEKDVETSTMPFGELPTSVSASAVPRAPRTRSFRFEHDGEGLITSSTLLGVRTTTRIWRALDDAPGKVLESETTAAATTNSARGVSSLSLGEAITRKFGYDGTYLKSFQANDLPALNFANVRGGKLSSEATNDAITSSLDVDRFGRPTKSAGRGGTDQTSAGTETILRYEADAGAQHARGLVTKVEQGELVTKIDYPTPGTIVTTDPRQVETTTELDEWLRPKHTFTSSAGLKADESATYDENGRVREMKRKQGERTVTETIDYDALGRVKKTTSDGIAVGDALTTTESRVDYDLAARTITRTLPGGAVIKELLDGLGRVKTRTTDTGFGTLREEVVYDLAGNVVYSANDHVAQAYAVDVHGRTTGVLAPDGTKTISQYDAMGQPTLVQNVDAAGTVISETKPAFTSAGRLTAIETKVDGARTRRTETKWDGAGRSTVVATEGRASFTTYAIDGRLRESRVGAGSLAGLTETFQQFAPNAHDGWLVKEAAIAEKGVPAILTKSEYDTQANPITTKIGALEWQQRFDQDGNVIAAQPPARPETTFEHDARGNVIAENEPGAVTTRHGYAASGAPESYRDPVDEVTSTISDRIGRPRQRTYSDGTSESWTYDGERVESMKDRQGRTFVYTYNPKGQLSELRNLGGEVLESYGYDAAGRLATWTTRDARLVYENFDMEGRPRRTRQIRYADRSGFGAATVLDEHVQEHEWNVHGERSAWTMPLPANFALPGWTNRVEEDHDAMGNVIAIRRSRIGSTAMAPLLTADYRNAGRPNVRTLTTTSGDPIVRTYGYDATTAQLNDLTVTARGLVVAGSGITFDGTQIAKATLHGVSNETRANEYAYDDLSRLARSRAARTSTATDPAIEHVDKADFRTGLERTTNGPDPLPSLSFVQQTGHKIAAMARGGEGRTFSYGSGAERIDDGRFVYEFDARGRLISATEKAAGSAPQSLRRILYYYSAADRVVGRRAEYAPLATGPVTTWKLEDRAAILDADALPAEVTFVWDPISDTLVTVAALNGQPLRQIIQGGNSYDDPIEVAVAESSTVHRLHPVFDEAGAGTLQIILNENGEVISRTVEEGAYGEDEYGLAGAAVDRVAIAATKTSSGALQSVTVSIRATEQLAASTIATGARLAVVDASGAVVRSSPTNATLFENYTLRWTLTAEEWTTLTSSTGNPQRLSIAVTNTLRAAAWDANHGILPAPDWAPTETMHSSTSLPVEYRASLAELDSWISRAAPSEKTLFEATSLSALGGTVTPAARLILAAGFQALPFSEPATGLIYARARWYDPSTGSFLTPDPMGYADSSNLYAFGGGDPVNSSDPTGLCLGFGEGTCADWANAGKKKLDKVRQFVDKHSGSTILDVGINAQVGFALDAVDAFVLDPLRFGDATGTAIGSGAGGVRTTLAVVQDIGRGAALAAGAGTVVKAAGKGAAAVRSVVAFDGLGEAASRGVSEGAAVATSELAPRITAGAVEEQRAATALAERLQAYKAWKAQAGIEGMPTSAQFRRFVGAHRPTSAGATLYPSANAFGGNSLFAQWSRALESVHGNSRLSPTMAYLYRLLDADGTFLKWGISQDPMTRYPAEFMRGKFIEPVMKGQRSIMLEIERAMVEMDPGPLNFESWAGAAQ